MAKETKQKTGADLLDPKAYQGTVEKADLLEWVKGMLGPARAGGLSGVRVLMDLEDFLNREKVSSTLAGDE